MTTFKHSGTNSAKKSTFCLRCSAALLFISLLFHCIAMGAPWWAAAFGGERLEHIGLWKFCAVTPLGWDSCDDFIQIQYSDWLKATESFYVLALFMLPISVGLVLLVNYQPPSYDRSPLTTVAAFVSIVIAAVFSIISLTVFGLYYEGYFRDKEDEWSSESVASLAWCFVLASCEVALLLAAAGLIPLALFYGRRCLPDAGDGGKQQSDLI